MNQFILGVLVGSVLTASLGMAGSNLYNKDGALRAPRGSQQQYDYFRQRQQFLDIGALRRHTQPTPCVR